jgi:hypothetical protein
MGSNHDHENADIGAHDFSFGIQVPDAGVRSIMAYTCPTSYCRRVNRWSNPEQEWKGYTFGVDDNEEDAADNHQSLNLTASIVAGFRDVPEVAKPTAPEILAPAPGTQLGGSSIAVVLSDVHADQYALTVGSTLGGAELGQYDMGGQTKEWVSGLPEDGRQLYIRGWARHGDKWVFKDASYTAHEVSSVVPSVPEMLTPAEGTRLSGPTARFTWTESSSRRVILQIGKAPEDSSLGQHDVTSTTSITVHDLPVDGSLIWVSIVAELDGDWDVNSYQYESFKHLTNITPAEMLAPSNGGDISSDVQFRWTTPCDCTFILQLKNEEETVIYRSDARPGFEGGADISGLPRGEHITATLFTLSEGRSFARDYEYDVY